MTPRRTLLVLSIVSLAALSGVLLGSTSGARAEGELLNVITSPDSGDVGAYASLALDMSGNPVVSYFDEANEDLKVLHCNDPNCSGGDESVTSPDTAGSVGEWTSLALDGSGNPVVSYFDAGNKDLKVMHCNDPDCSGGDESIVSPDAVGNLGAAAGGTSLILDASGNPVVSYYDGTNGDLKVLHCDDPDCSGNNESITSPDTDGFVGLQSSLALDASGNPVVSYNSNANLHVMHCNDPNCAGGNESISSPDTDGFVGFWTSLKLDSSGYPVISYGGQNGSPPAQLFLMRCNDANCSGGDESISSPDGSISHGEYTSLELDAAGNPVVAYGVVFTVLHCNDPDCGGGDESVRRPDFRLIGLWTSLALDAAGNPVVAYQGSDGSAKALKLLHCGTPTCAIGVGGIAELAEAGVGRSTGNGPSARGIGTFLGSAAAAAIAVGLGAAWYAKRGRRA